MTTQQRRSRWTVCRPSKAKCNTSVSVLLVSIPWVISQICILLLVTHMTCAKKVSMRSCVMFRRSHHTSHRLFFSLDCLIKIATNGKFCIKLACSIPTSKFPRRVGTADAKASYDVHNTVRIFIHAYKRVLTQCCLYCIILQTGLFLCYLSISWNPPPCSWYLIWGCGDASHWPWNLHYCAPYLWPVTSVRDRIHILLSQKSQRKCLKAKGSDWFKNYIVTWTTSLYYYYWKMYNVNEDAN